MSTKKLLFIAHDASRTGGPMVLLNFLKWLKKNKQCEFDILLLKDGPIRKDFEQLAQTYFIPVKYKYSLKNKVLRRLNPHLSDQYKISEVVRKLSANNYNLVFGNTIVTLPWLLQFKSLANLRTICSIHEMTNVIEYYFERKYVIEELPKVDVVIAGSSAVKQNLMEDFGIAAKQINVVHAFIDIKFNVSSTKAELRKELGIKDKELVIGGMGLIELRKGIDLLVPLAVQLKNNHPDVLFKIVWVGGHGSDNFIQIVKRDAKKCGVDDRVIFIENTSRPDDYINLYDIFVLLSREDPFPLVLLSAANMAKPIIAFEKSGGAEELLSEGAGFLAPYLNIRELARIISDLYQDPIRMKESGVKAKLKIDTEFNSDVIPGKIFNIIQKVQGYDSE